MSENDPVFGLFYSCNKGLRCARAQYDIVWVLFKVISILPGNWGGGALRQYQCFCLFEYTTPASCSSTDCILKVPLKQDTRFARTVVYCLV